MSQENYGTVSVTYNSQTVVADISADWTNPDNALAGGSPVYFSVVGDIELAYQVASIDFIAGSPGHWQLTLVNPYQGATQVGAGYILHTDFTANLQLALFSPGDLQTAQLLSRNFEALDALGFNIQPVRLVAAGITVLTSLTPADLIAIPLPTWMTRWHASSGAAGSGFFTVVATAAVGTLAGATFQVWDAAGGTGTQIFANTLGPVAAGQATLGAAAQANYTSIGDTIYIRQTTNSANAGTVSFYVQLSPLPF